MAKLAADAAAANAVADRLRKGEDVPAKIERPMKREEFLASVGWTEADAHHVEVVCKLDKMGATREAIEAVNDERRRRAVFRKVLRSKMNAARL
jgi:hypothetical protein